MPATILTPGVDVESIALVRSSFVDRTYERLIRNRPLEPLVPGAVEIPGSGVRMAPALEVFFNEPEEEATRLLVRLDVTLSETENDTFEAGAGFVGQFVVHQASPLSAEAFARNAVIYLIPFVRQHLAQLTTESGYDRVLLPPLNVDEMMKGMGQQPAAESEASTVPAAEATKPATVQPEGSEVT